MTLEEIEAALAEEALAQEQQRANLISDLQATSESQTADRDRFLTELQDQFRTQQESVVDLPTVTTGLQETIDALTGSNFARSAQALQNQRALLAAGQDPVSQRFREQLAQEQALQKEDDLSPSALLSQELQLEKEGRNARNQDLRLQLEAEKAAIKAAQDAEKAALKAQQDAQKAAQDRADKAADRLEKKRVNDSIIAKNRAAANKTAAGSGGGGGSFNPSEEKSFIGKAQGFAVQRNNRLGIKSSAASLRKDTQGVIDGLVKAKNKSNANTQRARSALKLLEDPQVAATNIAQIQTLILKASGEVGNLTEAERNSVNGVNKSFFERVKAALRREGTGTLSLEQLTELRRVAGIFLADGERLLSTQAVAAKNQFLDLGLTEQDIIGTDGGQGLASLSGVDPKFFQFQSFDPDKPVNSGDGVVDSLLDGVDL